ncbi:MAG: PaaI family thioesterase [Hyphomicrobiales bacterium]
MSDLTPELQAIYSGRYWAHMGIEVVEVGDGRCTSRIALKDHHFNYNDVVHGGVISGLIDSAAGLAVRSVRDPEAIRDRPHATSDLHVSYLGAAMGTELVARSRVLKAGRTAIFTEVEVFDDRDRMVARGSVTFVIAAGRPLRDQE